MRFGAELMVAAAAVAVVTPARAQVDLQTQLSARQVQVGEPFNLQLSVMSSSDVSPTNYRLPVPAGISVRGPSVSSQTQVSITNGQLMRRSGVTVTWTLVAAKPGTYRVGPASVDLGSERAQGRPVTVEVVPAGQGAAPGRGRGIPSPLDPFDPFSPFGGRGFPGFPFNFDDNDAQQQPPEPSAPPEYQLDHAPDPNAFLISKASPRKVVLGQAVHLRIYAYGGRGKFDPVSANEPSRDGFLAFEVDSGPDRVAVPVRIGDQVFIAAKMQEMVLFPIRTGTLRIGPMRFGFGGAGYPPSPGAPGMIRESPPIDITVVEPPLAGRPPGYRLGDVGRYALSATVDPKTIRQGESVSVIAKLEGTGNLPSKLDVPQQTGVEWADPTTIEKLDAREGTVRGSRTFTYVVRVDRTGTIDLGELTLPYYDPDQKRYDVARARLGRLEVREDPSAAGAAPTPSAGPPDRLRDLLHPQTTLRKVPPKTSYLTDKPSFLALLFGAPITVLMGSVLIRAGKSLGGRFRVRHETPAKRAVRELDGARTSAAQGDLATTSAAVERAVHLAVEAVTGLKGRGVLRSELAMALTARGLPKEVGERVVVLLEQTEQARFVNVASETQAADVLASGESLVRSILRGRRG